MLCSKGMTDDDDVQQPVNEMESLGFSAVLYGTSILDSCQSLGAFGQFTFPSVDDRRREGYCSPSNAFPVFYAPFESLNVVNDLGFIDYALPSIGGFVALMQYVALNRTGTFVNMP